MAKANSQSKSIQPGGVDEYIAACPPAVQDQLKEIRAAIREITPGSIETVSYFDMPGCAYDGYNYNGMFVWFSYKKPFIRLHLRPPVIQDHNQELADYSTTKSIVSFPADKELPISLVKKLVKASLVAMKNKAL